MLLIIIVVVIFISLSFYVLSQRFEKSINGKEIPITKKTPLVSVVVPAYKSEVTIGKTLDSIIKSDYPKKEIIVINDSDDRTSEIAKRYGAKVIQNMQRGGKGNALNKGAKEANGEFLLFLDSDTMLERDTLSKLVSSFYHYRSEDPKTSMVVPEYIGSNQHMPVAKISHLEQRTHQTWLKSQMNLGSILSIRGSCMLIRKSDFERTGGFIPTVLEDGDFVARMYRLGYRIKYEPRACARVIEPETLGEFFRAKKRYGKGTLFCALKHKRVYLASKHAAFSFYPGFLVLALLLIFVLTTPLANILTGIALLFLIPAITLVNIKFAPRKLSRKKYHMHMTGLCLMPVIILAYLFGVASGIRDKLIGNPELKFRDW